MGRFERDSFRGSRGVTLRRAKIPSSKIQDTNNSHIPITDLQKGPMVRNESKLIGSEVSVTSFYGNESTSEGLGVRGGVAGTHPSIAVEVRRGRGHAGQVFLRIGVD